MKHMLDKIKKLFTASTAEPSEEKNEKAHDLIVPDFEDDQWEPGKIKYQYSFAFSGNLSEITGGIKSLTDDGYEVTNISHSSYFSVGSDGNREVYSCIVICKK
jgi:hypothetical protein